MSTSAWPDSPAGSRQAVLVLAGAVCWPIAHIGDIAWLAVVVNVLLVVGFGSQVWHRDRGALV